MFTIPAPLKRAALLLTSVVTASAALTLTATAAFAKLDPGRPATAGGGSSRGGGRSAAPESVPPVIETGLATQYVVGVALIVASVAVAATLAVTRYRFRHGAAGRGVGAG